MQTQIYSGFMTKKGPQLVTIFGYSTKSIPGLEINGLGKHGKTVKEKIIYLTKKNNLKIPLARFVINVEISDEWGEVNSKNIKWLEYAFLVLYWHLAGVFPMKGLEKCFALGSISAEGVVEELAGEKISALCREHDLIWISSFEHPFVEKRIDAQDVIEKVMSFKLKGFEQVFCIQ